LTNMPKARLIVDPPAEGSWNMAVDEALLESAASSGEITLRFYQWSPATLSLGYFQSHADRQSHLPSLNCPLVRRSTGGGAIVHDHELTYSLVVPLSSRFGDAAAALYDAMHRSFIKTLAHWGIKASLYAPPKPPVVTHGQAIEPFLCFQRRSAGDVIIGGQKVVGSAQRRHRGSVLQHGSVLLRQTAAAPELPGICDLASTEITAEELQTGWLREILASLDVEAASRPLSATERQLAQRVQSTKFEGSDWTLKR
jgi:lipoate-protein ligase A